MSTFVKNSIRFILVSVGIVLLTSFTIDATDTLRQSQTALSVMVEYLTDQSCPKGMIAGKVADRKFCIDIYEASPNTDCVYLPPKSIIDTTHNIADSDCRPVSEASAVPWTFLAVSQAKQLCAKKGMRLPTPDEWFVASLGTPDSINNCSLDNELMTTGGFPECVSGSGAFDMVGNVWEFVDGNIYDGKYNDQLLPEEGFVSLADGAGLALETGQEANPIYNHDYFWSNQVGQYSIMRGGFYGSRDKGGIYSTYGSADEHFASVALGFRCALSLE